MTENKSDAPQFFVEHDDGTVVPVVGTLGAAVAKALEPLATVFAKKTKPKPRVMPRIASKGHAVEASVKPGDAAPPVPEHGTAPRIHEVERDIPEPKLRVPPMPERRWEDSNESYKARVAKWAADKDKARVAHEARLKAYHAGPKVRVEQVMTWTRNPTAPAMAPSRSVLGTPGVGHMAPAPLSFEDKVTRLCVGLLRAEQAPASERLRLETQALDEAGHDVVVAANREGMVSGKRLTNDGREQAVLSVDDFAPKPLKPVELTVAPETATCPICGHVIDDFKAHVMARHVYPDTKTPAKKKPAKKAPAKKAAKKAAKKTAESKAKKPRAKKKPQPKEEVHV